MSLATAKFLNLVAAQVINQDDMLTDLPIVSISYADDSASLLMRRRADEKTSIQVFDDRRLSYLSATGELTAKVRKQLNDLFH